MQFISFVFWNVKVKEAFERSNKQQVAVKIIKEEKWPCGYSEPEDLMKEVQIPLNLEEHLCIIKVLEVFDEKEVLTISYVIWMHIISFVLLLFQIGNLFI